MNSGIIILVIVVVSFLILRSAAKILFKLLSVVLILGFGLGFLYYKSWWPFEDYSITMELLSRQYCEDIDDEDICDCVVKKIRDDMAERFTEDEIKELMDQKIKALYVLQRSQAATKDESMACLKERGAEEKYDQFIKEVLTIDNGVIDHIEEGTDSLKSKIGKHLKDIFSEKDEIDERY